MRFREGFRCLIEATEKVHDYPHWTKNSPNYTIRRYVDASTIRRAFAGYSQAIFRASTSLNTMCIDNVRAFPRLNREMNRCFIV